ncbi:hypothetical protein [Streptomyces sp. NRRL S-87]|uniref:hypothetical protein n=1 Tax=Streptomyces sp. NRRL S-87 TaxID=1463920 RepID=UPI000B014908|nr:hypothetical protein [Streptomyces sp. NRRL S-87]
MSKTTRWLLAAAAVVWSVFAYQWMDVGCDVPKAYLAVLRYGTPEGLEFLPACHG